MSIDEEQLREELILGDESPTVIVSDKEEMKEAVAAFEEAQSLKRLADNYDFQVLLRAVDENAVMHARILLNSNSLDPKLAVKQSNHDWARRMAEFIHEKLDGAKDTPRPILQ